MPTDPKPAKRLERFTMLEPKAPNNLTDEQKTWRSVELDECLLVERFTMLEESAPLAPEVERKP
jgi:hypothetical protein